MKVFVINVGVNASHVPLRSPLFTDGGFEFVPIPETKKLNDTGIGLLRYSDLFGDARFIPPSRRAIVCHPDPEFDTHTYGDFPSRAGRPSALRRVEMGDILLFLARLVPWDGERFDEGGAGFYFVGQLVVAETLKGLEDIGENTSSLRFERNAHVLRARANARFRDDSWVFRGGFGSCRYQRAVPFTWSTASRAMLDRNGKPWVKLEGRTDLQSIGSYTRSVRALTSSHGVGVIREEIAKWIGRDPWPASDV